jgi:predicted Zn-dependent peptidase
MSPKKKTDSIHKFVLSNGLTVVAQSTSHISSVSAGLFVKLGSVHEKDSEAGYCHFLEHMLFKGTTNRNAKEIAIVSEKNGGILNAATTREFTYYYFTFVDAQLFFGLDLLKDLVFNSILDSDDIKNESKVIMEEKRSYDDSPEDFIYDFYFKNIFKNTSLGREVIGTEESITSITSPRLKAFYRKYYKPENMVLSISGNFDIKKLQSYLNKNYSGLSNKGIVDIPKVKEAKIGLEHHFSKKKTEQIHYYLGFPGYKRNLETSHIANLLCTILGGGMASRLFQKVREDNGLCYSIQAFPSMYEKSGIVSVSCSTSRKHLIESLKIIKKELEDLLKNGISEIELENAKNNQIGNATIGFESSESKMYSIGALEIYYKRYLSLHDRVERIKSVTMDDVNNAIHDFFNIKKIHFSGLGDFSPKDIKEVTNILS